MSNSVIVDPNRRHDFVLLFDVMDGNPNGDPDAGNLPRVDPETMHGLVTDVCLKRKVRNYVEAVRGADERYKIYVQNRGILANQQKRAYQALGVEPGKSANALARKWMCDNFFDVRVFGAVMTVGRTKDEKDGKQLHWNCGQVRGPIQMTFARSIDQVVPLDLSITRVALTNPDDTGRGEVDDQQAASGQMGRKSIIPYGLYRGYGFVSSALGEDTGLTEEDLGVFWQALQQMWDLDRSASRGFMACRGLYVFSHENGLGNAPAHTLLDRIQPRMKDDVQTPRRFDDYTIAVDDADLPEGVSLTRLVG
ncbi:MAG: type I-C CRISPR-associated protein Cas7/Csd2 [Desulforudis sp.]|jgi:CRISPR-associated protein Csd2|nr:MAG: type I-C CRISPR-associated protein Cas7/Csd2 [Desulforudis sp.]